MGLNLRALVSHDAEEVTNANREPAVVTNLHAHAVEVLFGVSLRLLTIPEQEVALELLGSDEPIG